MDNQQYDPTEKSQKSSSIHENETQEIHNKANLFRLNLYKWARQDFQREVEEDFPFLRVIKGSMAWRLLALMESLEGSERLQLASSLVKGIAGDEILSLAGEVWTDVDADWRRKFRQSCIIEPITYDLEEKFLQQALRREINVNFQKKKFKKFLETELEPILGRKTLGQGYEFGYRGRVGDWNVDTWIDVGSSFQLRYHHIIYSSNQEEFVLEPRIINFLKWLGVGETEWGFLTEEELPFAANTLGNLCSHFLNAVPYLLDENH